jgi:hypothetical protein
VKPEGREKKRRRKKSVGYELIKRMNGKMENDLY